MNKCGFEVGEGPMVVAEEEDKNIDLEEKFANHMHSLWKTN